MIIINSQGVLAQKCTFVMYHAFYSDGTNILKLYDCSTFTPKILLYVKTLQKLELTIK